MDFSHPRWHLQIRKIFTLLRRNLTPANSRNFTLHAETWKYSEIDVVYEGSIINSRKIIFFQFFCSLLNKGGLISERFFLCLRYPKTGTKSQPWALFTKIKRSCSGLWFITLFCRQTEKPSEIMPLLLKLFLLISVYCFKIFEPYWCSAHCPMKSSNEDFGWEASATN